MSRTLDYELVKYQAIQNFLNRYSREKDSRRIQRIRKTFSLERNDKREIEGTCTKTSYRNTQENNTIGQNRYRRGVLCTPLAQQR